MSEPNLDPEALRRLANEYLGERYTMALATSGPEGLWVASVYYAGNLQELYFLSSPDSRHGCNLTISQSVAAAINEDEHNWRAIRGIQLEGACAMVSGALELPRAWAVYFARFPMVRALLSGEGVSAAAAARMAKTRLYRLRPSRLFYLDNRQGFGDRREVPLG